ncbi:MAG: SufD family Fe-S cluster assembly protein, partial [Candidatus Micrarchaeota archaeon]|nr:SufD family Fe-S cluster assembly protein [Candidatus Micrarchaeota archaeon]
MSSEYHKIFFTSNLNDYAEFEFFDNILVKENTEKELVIVNDKPIQTDQLANINVICKKDSSLKLFYIIPGIFDKYIQNCKITVNLAEKRANAEVYVLSKLTGHAYSKTELNIFHESEETKSFALSTALVFDYSKSIFNGHVKILNGAINSDAYLKDSSLMIGNNSEVISVPSMIIEENDVKAGHAATIGTINEEEVFYMKTRGLTEKDIFRLIEET